MTLREKTPPGLSQPSLVTTDNAPPRPGVWETCDVALAPGWDTPSRWPLEGLAVDSRCPEMGGYGSLCKAWLSDKSPSPGQVPHWVPYVGPSGPLDLL